MALSRKSPNLLRARCDFCRPAAVMMDQSMFLYTGTAPDAPSAGLSDTRL